MCGMLFWIEYRSQWPAQTQIEGFQGQVVGAETEESLRNDENHRRIQKERERERVETVPLEHNARDGGSGGGGDGWSHDLITRFKAFQDVMNKNAYQYNLKMTQENAKAWEVEALLRTGKWPWTKEVQMRYRDAMVHHPILNYEPTQATLRAQEIYPQKVALMLIAHAEAKRKRTSK